MLKRALALIFALAATPALAQVTPGTSPLTIAKGGTNAATASAARTNLGLAIGTNVEAWDADLDCLAAISATGVLRRTGAGTCSAGTVALSDLTTGTQDTVIGYFGSTAASALAIGNCLNALTYNTSTHVFGCNTTAGTGTVTQVICGATVITASGTCPTIAVVKIQAFTASGTYTPSTGLVYAQIECIGAGGGGGGIAAVSSGSSAGGGGGAGAYSRVMASAATIGASQTVTIGAAGTGAATGANTGGTGGTTSVGTICASAGGSGGVGAASNGQGIGGLGGLAASGTGTVKITGGSGSTGAQGGAGGSGGASFLGGGASGQLASGGGPTSPVPGGGGGGAFGTSGAVANAGGAGGAGYVIITEYTSQ